METGHTFYTVNHGELLIWIVNSIKNRDLYLCSNQYEGIECFESLDIVLQMKKDIDFELVTDDYLEALYFSLQYLRDRFETKKRTMKNWLDSFSKYCDATIHELNIGSKETQTIAEERCSHYNEAIYYGVWELQKAACEYYMTIKTIYKEKQKIKKYSDDCNSTEGIKEKGNEN